MMTTSTTDRFSAHYSEWLWYNWVDFFSQIRSRILTPVGFCIISLWSFMDSFQTTKGTHTMVTPPTC